MADKWTDRQLEAIEARNASVIVSAAAGSGKTSVLVERLLRILSDNENRVPADKIIVVTFTNDAAAQMKQRLSDAIAKQLKPTPRTSGFSASRRLSHRRKFRPYIHSALTL